MDSLGNKDATADYINQLDVYAATRCEKTGTCIPGVRLYTGNSDTTGQKNVSGTCDVTNYFDANATEFKAANATKLVYNYELVKNCNGYVCNWYNDDWSEIKNTITVYNPDKFLQQIHVAGNHNTVEMCEMYRNGSTGLQISYSGGEPKCWWPSYNTILNCTSYYNCDSKRMMQMVLRPSCQ